MTNRKGALWATLVAVIIILAVIGAVGCTTTPPLYDCKTWSPDDPDLYAKRNYCFPDCASCGPAFRYPHGR